MTKIQFPESISYKLASGFKSFLKQPKQYLGNKVSTELAEVTVNVLLKTDDDMGNFLHWYIKELDYGKNDFQITMPIFGMLKTWSVEIVNDLSDQLSYATVRQISLTLKVLNDIKEAVDEIVSPMLYMPMNEDLRLVDGVGNATFTRNSIATYYDNGVLKTAAINEPRIEDGWFLHEGESTNELLNNDTGDWDTSAAGTGVIPTITQNYGISPSGEQNAHRVQFDLGGGTTTDDQSNLDFTPFSSVVGEPISHYCWIKSTDGNSKFVMRHDFNGATADNPDDSMITITGEWQRFSMSLFAPIDTSRRPRLRLRGAIGTSDVADVLVCFGQTERFPLPTSYIPTSDTEVTRASDDLKIGYQGNVPSLYEDKTYVINFKPLGKNTIDDMALIETFSYAYNLIRINKTTAYVSAYSDAASINTEDLDFKIKNTVVATYSKDEKLSLFSNGGFVETRDFTYHTENAAKTDIYIGSRINGTNKFYGHIGNVKIFDKVLTPEQIKKL